MGLQLLHLLFSRWFFSFFGPFQWYMPQVCLTVLASQLGFQLKSFGHSWEELPMQSKNLLKQTLHADVCLSSNENQHTFSSSCTTIYQRSCMTISKRCWLKTER